MVPSEKDLVFRYTAPVDQDVLSKPLNPVLNDRQFCGFGRHLLVFPELKNRTLKSFSLTIKHPENWTLVTSLGASADTLTFDNTDDLRGLMICAGDYTVKEFTLPNKTRQDPTRTGRSSSRNEEAPGWSRPPPLDRGSLLAKKQQYAYLSSAALLEEQFLSMGRDELLAALDEIETAELPQATRDDLEQLIGSRLIGLALRGIQARDGISYAEVSEMALRYHETSQNDEILIPLLDRPTGDESRPASRVMAARLLDPELRRKQREISSIIMSHARDPEERLAFLDAFREWSATLPNGELNEEAHTGCLTALAYRKNRANHPARKRLLTIQVYPR